jgi:hypothetical protein
MGCCIINVLILNIVLVRLWRVNPVKKISLKELTYYDKSNNGQQGIMKSLGKWSINNRVTVNLIMIFIIVARLITVSNMRRELNPDLKSKRD